jgi:hypothetical protein
MHAVRRVDLSSFMRRRKWGKQRTSIHDLHDSDHGHIGIDIAFHDYDTHVQ